MIAMVSKFPLEPLETYSILGTKPIERFSSHGQWYLRLNSVVQI